MITISKWIDTCKMQASYEWIVACLSIWSYEPNDNIKCDHIKWLPLCLRKIPFMIGTSVKNFKKYGIDKLKNLFSLNSELSTQNILKHWYFTRNKCNFYIHKTFLFGIKIQNLKLSKSNTTILKAKYRGELCVYLEKDYCI
jgi:hypothetical protein